MWNGEWFENMRNNSMGENANVPYRRESFSRKRIIIDFDGDFSLTDASVFGNDARTKSLERIQTDLDSLNHTYDSIGNAYYKSAKQLFYPTPKLDKQQATVAMKQARKQNFNIDTIFAHQTTDNKKMAVEQALQQVNMETSDLEFKSMVTTDGDRIIRQHKIEMINKFTVALSCLIFFFIGAPLGAIIRKGGLGVPIITSVVVFIIYYILDKTGY